MIQSRKIKVGWLNKLLFAIILLSVAGPQVISQTTDTRLVPLRVRKSSYVWLNDSLKYFNHDTILYLPNAVIPPDQEAINRNMQFYDSLKTRSSRNMVTKSLYSIAIVLPPDRSNQDITINVNENFEVNRGKTIREIKFIRLSVFGTNINDPEQNSATGFSNILNKTHLTTREFIIRNYIRFEKGDLLSPFALSESERIIRRLKYIDDARIIVTPVENEMVDITVITRDVYSLALMYEVRGLKSGTVKLLEKNLMGFGNHLSIEFPYDYYKDYYGFGYGATYKIKNINRTLIDASVSYANALGQEYYDLNISREFITPLIKYAGGFNVRETYTTDNLDTLDIREKVEYNRVDLWLGRSFILDKQSLTRAVFSARFINNNVFTRPEITSTSFHHLQKYKLYLGSISLVNQRYFKTNLIYNYGRTEDMPYGSKIGITYGKEFNEFYDRDYYGLEASFADQYEKLGYIYGSGKFGVFIRKGFNEQGVVNFDFRYISNLNAVGRYRLRYKADINFTKGFNRFDDEYLMIKDDYGIRGFRNDSIFPDQRLYLNLETIAFSPTYIWGFRVAFYGYIDLVFSSKNKLLYQYDSLISGIGLGISLRNDNLLFKTLHLRVGYFPNAPSYSHLRYFEANSEKLLEPPGFDPVAPAVVPYR
ncbi:MAG: hypothetical protein K8R35_00010 [Bacteroidales bacterium]|nr:hypothetical protein [Bacteroidales bacterium]